MIFDYCGIDKSNVVENFDINNVPDTYIFMLQDLVCCNRIIGIRYNEDFEEPYDYYSNTISVHGKTRNEALWKLVEEFCKEGIFTRDQDDKLFYIMGYISGYEK